MATKSKVGATATHKAGSVASAPRLSDLIAEAADIKARAAKLLADLLLCKAAGGDNAYGGDVPDNKNAR